MLRSRLLALGCLAALAVPAVASDPAPAAPGVPKVAFILIQAQEEKKAEPKKDEPPLIDFAEAPPEQLDVGRGLNPHMLGDQQGSFTVLNIPVVATGILNIDGRIQTVTVKRTRRVRVPLPGRGGYKIAENEGVLPTDRALFTYNYYSDVQGPNEGAGDAQTATIQVEQFGQFFPVQITIPGVTTPRFHLHRETFGFEKTFFDGMASFGMRAPFFQQVGVPEEQDFGDMTFIFKVAPFLDSATGAGVSMGLAVTAPTGPGVTVAGRHLHSTIIQPFVGYVYSPDRFFLHGFTSAGIPSDERDAALLFNDLGVGYWLYRDSSRIISGVAPTVEAHVTTPLDNRNESDLVRGIDLLVITSGAHLQLGERALLTLGVAVPITGPRPFEAEAIVQFNVRF